MQIFLDLAAIQSYSWDIVIRVFKVLKLGHFKNYLMENIQNGNGKLCQLAKKTSVKDWPKNCFIGAETAVFLLNSFF